VHDVALRPWNILSFCAGVGGLELGIRIAEPGARGVAYVEREAAAAASLVASMEAGWFHPAPVWSDAGTFDARPWRGVVDCVASGDPCQPNSVAGKGLGADDSRWLIDQLLRIVDECRPHRLFRENVCGNIHGQLAALVPPLEAMGFRVASGIFSATEAGASHRRERFFVMADHADGAGRLHAGQWRPGEGEADARGLGRRLGNPDCPPGRSARGAGEPSCGSGAQHGVQPRRPGGGDLADAVERQPPERPQPEVTRGIVGQGDAAARIRCDELANAERGLHNDGEEPGTFLARQAELKAQGINGNGAGTPLAMAVKLWPTPAATETRQGYQQRPEGMASEQNQQSLTTIAIDFHPSPPAPQTPAGPTSSPERRSLNPLFVEWLMGWPTGLSGFERAETEFSRWLRQMRGCLSALRSSRTAEPEQGRLF
jgi:site-specific DNA-cytosine methylase